MPVKINTTRSRAKKAMRKKNSTKYRPEQILVHDIINECYVGGSGLRKIEMEYLPPDIIPIEGTDLTGERSPRLDIYLQTADLMNYAVRLNGPYHDDQKQERKDFIQKTFLEMQPERWFVIDFDYIKMQNVFKRNLRKLTPGELILAYNEIKKNLLPFGINLSTPTDKIFEKLALSHSA